MTISCPPSASASSCARTCAVPWPATCVGVISLNPMCNAVRVVAARQEIEDDKRHWHSSITDDTRPGDAGIRAATRGNAAVCHPKGGGLFSFSWAGTYYLLPV